ncbi:hypothetical protein M433DRAFT_224634 [Acidomyces richmondensis BFW]|nr:MAG: hypothetical protein FE78DRAFT_73878 [Acidomyces sp. 'richmondensis']KYG46059.1 hypothetical protein M433DRAFT_224634 [Acidomyces richmondensis BFW]
MAIDIVDLTQDSDLDESPRKTANAALARFTPRNAKSAVNGLGHVSESQEVLRIQNGHSPINGVNAQQSDDAVQSIEDAEFNKRFAKRRKITYSDFEFGNKQPIFEHTNTVGERHRAVTVETVRCQEHDEQQEYSLDLNVMNMSHGCSDLVRHMKISHMQPVKDSVYFVSESLRTATTQESPQPFTKIEICTVLQKHSSSISHRNADELKRKNIRENRELKEGINFTSGNFRVSPLSSSMSSGPIGMPRTASKVEGPVKAPRTFDTINPTPSLAKILQPVAVHPEEDGRVQSIPINPEAEDNILVNAPWAADKSNQMLHRARNSQPIAVESKKDQRLRQVPVDSEDERSRTTAVYGEPTKSPVRASQRNTVTGVNVLPELRQSTMTPCCSRLAYTADDNLLLAQLKEVTNLSWDDIMAHFPGRSGGSLQTHFCTEIKRKNLETNQKIAINNLPNHGKTEFQASLCMDKSTEGTHSNTLHQTSESEVFLSKCSLTDPNVQLDEHAYPSLSPIYSAYRSQSPPPPEARKEGTFIMMENLPRVTSRSKHGELYTPEDDALLSRLKDIEGLSWNEIATYFPGRTKHSLQFRYSSKLKGKSLAALPSSKSWQDAVHATMKQPSTNLRVRRLKRERGHSAEDGFIPWDDSKKRKLVEDGALKAAANEFSEVEAADVDSLSRQDRTYPSAISRVLRQRELGTTCGRGWAGPVRGISDELINHALDGYHLRRHFERMGGDVTCVAWSPDGIRFAAGSIPVSDDRSMQYNNQLNLLVGNSTDGTLFEQPEHHVPRPLIDDDDNINSLRSMRETQDSRLFKTVTAVAFSPNGKHLYTAGSDAMLRMYRVKSDEWKTKCQSEIKHPASVDLLSVNNSGVLATGCHSSADGCVQVFQHAQKTFNLRLSLSSQRTEAPSALPIFPSALRWGVAHHHSNFLLAGFTSDSVNDETDFAGDTALWNVETGQRVPLRTVTRFVFDVAWNPTPSSASTAFAVASTPGTGKPYKGKSSVVQCYAPGQNMARQVLEWECPASDINDVVYCPHDSNLIAAGATDGKVYVWDKRFANRNQKPLHTLTHGDSLNVLDPYRDREQTDTGIRFLSWAATGSRLYSGSSDGVVKVWNPYRAPDNAQVQEIATFHSSIMSGAFSTDYRDLLIGEESGRINLLSINYDDEDGAPKPSSSFKLHRAPVPHQVSMSEIPSAHELLESGQIELKPMGDLPVRQAVQGPHYKGPYLKPSINEREQAQKILDRAIQLQKEAKSALKSTQRKGTDEEISKAESVAEDSEKRLNRARDALEHMSRRYDDALKLEPSAAENQHNFYELQKKRAELEATHPAEPCDLDCNYLPKEAPFDCGRSEQRVPSAIQALPRSSVDLSKLDCKAFFEAGLSGKCMYCSIQTSNPLQKMQLKHLCLARLASIKSKFTMTCEYCKTPIRQTSGKDAPSLCEGCNFTCFRCTLTLQVVSSRTEGGQSLYCSHCGVSWIPGVLGYEIVQDDKPKSRNELRLNKNHIEDLDGEDTELIFYHSKWQCD